MGPWSLEPGKDPWKLTWVGLLLLSNLFQAAQQGVNVGLDLRQLCLDGLQLTALYWEWREYRAVTWGLGALLTQDPSPILTLGSQANGRNCPCLQLFFWPGERLRLPVASLETF